MFEAITEGSIICDEPADNRIDFDALELILGDRHFGLEWLGLGGQVDVPFFASKAKQYHSAIVDAMERGDQDALDNYGAYDVLVDEPSDENGIAANVVSSALDENTSIPMIDLDFPAALIPSSTPGHWHLYLDKPMPNEEYAAFVSMLKDFGIVAEGNVNQVKRENKTFLRLPWVKKGFLGRSGRNTQTHSQPTTPETDTWLDDLLKDVVIPPLGQSTPPSRITSQPSPLPF